MHSKTKTHLADAAFHLGNAQRSLNQALLVARGGDRTTLTKMVDRNGKLLNFSRRWLEMR
jgi:hypothetical protein